MAKKFIKTIYIETRQSANAKAIPEKVDLYETDCYVIYKTTTIANEVYEQKDKKGTSYFEKYSTAKKYLETEFNQELCDEFERQSKEYRKQIMFKAEQSVAEREVETRIDLFTIELKRQVKEFKGDWVEFVEKIKVKTEEMYLDFNKSMKENNK